MAKDELIYFVLVQQEKAAAHTEHMHDLHSAEC